MADTFTQLNIQLVFAVSGRQNFLSANFRYRLFEYLGGILKKMKHYPLAINGYIDHIHIFLELNPACSIADLVRDIKTSTSLWINSNQLTQRKFAWQKGYGAFSYSKSQRSNVIQYIANQEAHHRKKTFKEEYIEFLKSFEIQYDEKYLFDWSDLPVAPPEL